MSIHYRVYWNGGSGGPVDYSAPVADGAGLSWVSPPLGAGSDNTWAVHPYDTDTGYEDRTADARVRVAVTGPGGDAAALPGAPFSLSVLPGAGGTARVLWHYGGPAPVDSFAVYVWPASGPPDFSTPAGTVPGTAGSDRGAPSFRRPFSFPVTGLADGVAYLVCVRGRNAAGEGQNAGAAAVTGAAAGPAPVRSLTATPTP